MQSTQTTPKYSLRLAALCGLLSLLLPASLSGQGCVVAHGSGLPANEAMGDASSPWTVSVAYRWFKSHRHYVGTVEQTQRAAAGDEVINRSNFTDVTVDYVIAPRYSASLTIPYVSHDRSQVVKNAASVILQRFSTQATGLADISLLGSAWVFDPATSTKGNLQLSLGFSLPTGKDDVRDIFMVFDRPSNQVVAALRTVDQSIQPGSGGYGIVLAFSGYRTLGAGFTAYGNATYTATPQEENGVPTFRSSVYETIMSIPDTYSARGGLEYAVPAASGLSLSLGLRAEGVPVYDLIGGSKGFRRPGYTVAVEPGIIYDRHKWSSRLYVPFAIQRDRQQSVPDRQKTAATGVYSQGDAAFADYLIMWTFSYKF